MQTGGICFAYFSTKVCFPNLLSLTPLQTTISPATILTRAGLLHHSGGGRLAGFQLLSQYFANHYLPPTFLTRAGTLESLAGDGGGPSNCFRHTLQTTISPPTILLGGIVGHPGGGMAAGFYKRMILQLQKNITIYHSNVQRKMIIVRRQK